MQVKGIILIVKSSPANGADLRDAGLIHRLGGPPRRAWQRLQYSCLENPMDRGARQAIVHRVAELDTAEVTKPAPLKWIIYPGSDY